MFEIDALDEPGYTSPVYKFTCPLCALPQGEVNLSLSWIQDAFIRHLIEWHRVTIKVEFTLKPKEMTEFYQDASDAIPEPRDK